MITFNQTDKTMRSIRSIMRNKNLSDVIKSALNSPVGSTERVKAQQIIRIIKKTSVNDGRGGNGEQNITVQPSLTPNIRPNIKDYSNMVVFPKVSRISKDNYNGTEKENNVINSIKVLFGSKNDGQGGPGNFLDFSNFSLNPSEKAKQALSGLALENIQTPSGQQTKVVPSLPFKQQTEQPQINNEKTTSSAIIPPAISFTSKKPSDKTISIEKPQTSVVPTSKTETSAIIPKTLTLEKAVTEKTGPTFFALQSLSNPEYLKKMGLPEEMISDKKTLSERLEEADNALRQSYRLDETLNQYTNMVNQGVGLEGRLTDYIRGRDEFLNETDKMLENFKDKALTMNMADPKTSAAAQSYANFLYELRGRQNKRYIEFLKTSIDDYNSRLTNTANLYNTSLNAYERELKRKEAITTEEYNLMFTGLSEMYNNAANAPKEALELALLREQINEARYKSIKSIIDASGNKSYLDSVTNLKKSGVNVILEDGTLNPNANLNNAALWESLGVSDPTNFFMATINAGKFSMTNRDKDGIAPNLTKVSQIGSNLADMIKNYYQQGQLKDDQAIGFLSQVQDGIAKGIKSNGIINESDVAGIKHAVDTLSKKRFTFSGMKPLTRSQFIDSKIGNLDRTLLDMIYTDFEDAGYLENPKEFSKHFLNDRDGRPLSDDKILSRVAYSYANKIGI